MDTKVEIYARAVDAALKGGDKPRGLGVIQDYITDANRNGQAVILFEDGSFEAIPLQNIRVPPKEEPKVAVTPAKTATKPANKK